MKIGRYAVFAGLTLVLAGGLSLFASSQPDGLERVAIDAGFIDQETSHWAFALFPDYQFGEIFDHWLADSLVGLIGVAIMFGTVWLLGKWLTKRRAQK